MRNSIVSAVSLIGLLAFAAPASAQLGSLLKKGMDQVGDLQVTDSEERAIGAQVSGKLRARFGVVQDPAVHKYVTLVGSVLAASSSRASLPWTFIVLDTDGVNAFAGPGGYIHITRGALALLQNEAELAGVLGHEIAHVTAKHTIRAIQKAKMVRAAQSASRSAMLSQVTDAAYASVIENGFDRNDEMEADAIGIVLANKAGYAAGGLGAFLRRLDERNTNQQEPNGLFASHPDTKARIDRLAKQVVSDRLTETAVVAARFQASITYKPVALAAIVMVADNSTGVTAPDPKKPASGGGFGLGKLTSPLGGERQSTQAVASGGSRGVGGDRGAKGGGNPAVVTTTITPVELAAFRNGIAG